MSGFKDESGGLFGIMDEDWIGKWMKCSSTMVILNGRAAECLHPDISLFPAKLLCNCNTGVMMQHLILLPCSSRNCFEPDLFMLSVWSLYTDFECISFFLLLWFHPTSEQCEVG